MASKNVFTIWTRKNSCLPELTKPGSCITMLASHSRVNAYYTGNSSNIDYLSSKKQTKYPKSYIKMKMNFTTAECKLTCKDQYKNTLFQPIRTLTRRWISTSAIKMESERRKMKEKIEKVKEIVHRESILTIPNLLSSFRIVAAPFLGYFILSEQFVYSVVLFGVAGITDMLDGYIARNFKNQKSIFGTILDPIADKVLMAVLAASLTIAGLIPVPLAALILGRDLMLVLVSFYFRFQSLPPPANTALQLGLVGTTLLAPVMGYIDHQYLHIVWYIVGTSTVLSSVSYMLTGHKAIRYLKK